ncbi:Zinc finger, C3HC4 type (RING finger) [Musa troglodytarum]|uniref:Zinc finger, C3HC4 type (RING finger) n=1 Tax=Musa troglodytarum TaxID=320322 RepID=A0A9E7HEI8_9LILI|nr:Zinc finger, C3HC4 type (RING finger) [Musa troglodytarum]
MSRSVLASLSSSASLLSSFPLPSSSCTPGIASTARPPLAGAAAPPGGP